MNRKVFNKVKIFKSIFFCIVFLSAFGSLIHREIENKNRVYVSLFPEFLEYEDFSEINVYLNRGSGKSEKLALSFEEQKELFDLLRFKLVRGIDGYVRFEATKGGNLHVLMEDGVVYDFVVMFEEDQRLRIKLADFRYYSKDLLLWFAEKIELK